MCNKKITLTSILFYFISICFFAQLKHTRTPSWVQKSNYKNNPEIAINESSRGVSFLLFDNQINNEKKEIYYRHVYKVIENTGSQIASTINILFDPSYQELTLHEIKIIRNGEVKQKLNVNDFQLLRRELNSESFIYDGSMTANNNLTDIRVGDIVDYSYTIKGFNPIHKNKFSTVFLLNDAIPYGKIHFSVLSKIPLHFQYKNTKKVFQEKKVNGRSVYSFSATNIEAIDFEENIPTWELVHQTVLISDYKSWKEIINWGVDIFRVSTKPNKELHEIINNIDKNNSTVGSKINAVLNFVQDEIRYLGLESGIGAYKPFQPNEVIKHRFGDCKDKSLLMVHMLNEMNIKAYPVLVSTSLKNTIKELIPSPKYFDHCIVKVIDNYQEEIWYDPTISNQGGNYRTTSLPDYRTGLTLNSELNNLEEINNDLINSMSVVDEFTLEEVGKGAFLKKITNYYNSEADLARNYFKNKGINIIKKEYESYLSNYYRNITSAETPTYKDNIKDNIFTVTERYQIDSIWSKNALIKNSRIIHFTPTSIVNSLIMPVHKERKNPFALIYPLAIDHTIKIKLPEKWNIEKVVEDIYCDEFQYYFLTDYLENEKLLTLKYTLETKSDHVSSSNFKPFYDALTKIDNNAVYSLYTYNEGNSFFSKIRASSYISLIIISILIIVCVYFSRILYKYNPKPKIESYFEENKQIGGWLVAIGILLCLTYLVVIVRFFSSNYISGEWLIFLQNSKSEFKEFFIFKSVLELLLNIISLVYFPLLIILFFKKRSSFPRLYLIALIILFSYSLINYFINRYVFKENLFIQEYKDAIILLQLTVTIVVSGYLIYSDRIKETFVNTITIK